MSGEPWSDYFLQQAQEAAEPPHDGQGSSGRRVRRRGAARASTGTSRRWRRVRKVALIGGVSLAVVVGAVVGGGYLMVNNLVSSIHRINGIVALDSAHQPVMPAVSRRSMTILLTGSMNLPGVIGGHGVDGSSQAGEGQSGLISLLHLNANHRGGAVVSIPGNAVVNIPGHGKTELWNALALGGPSLLIETVERLTDVRIDHYSVLDFGGVSRVIRALHGVDVDVPYPFTSFGVTFPAGIDLLTGADVLDYVRQPGVSEIGRVLLQQNLIRAMMTKIASGHLLRHFGTDWSVLHALASVLSVDSNFSNSQLESLGLRLGSLRGRGGAFVTAPTVDGSARLGGTSPVHLNRRITRLLWQAIRTDSVSAFARRFPLTVTPGAPG